MRRLWIALGWMLAFEVVWAVLLFPAAAWLVDRNWLAENFLNPSYLSQPNWLSYASDMIAALQNAAAAVFVIGVACAALWHVLAAFHRIYGPGEAAAWWWVWVILLLVGVAGAFGAVYWYVAASTNDLILSAAMYDIDAAAVLLLFLTYYIGTCFPTPPKWRPAVPLARFLPAGW